MGHRQGRISDKHGVRTLKGRGCTTRQSLGATPRGTKELATGRALRWGSEAKAGATRMGGEVGM